MNWINIWNELFGTTSLFGIDMGFWVGMSGVCLIVIVMHVVFWGVGPKKK